MMDEVSPQAKDHSWWSFRNVYFLDNMTDNLPEPKLHKDVPAGLHMMNHVYRSANYTKPGHYIKCFHNTEHVLTIHNHYPTRCLGGCKAGGVDTRLGHLQHYREFCVSDLWKVCDEAYMKHIERDTSVWKWRENVTRAMTEKGLV